MGKFHRQVVELVLQRLETKGACRAEKQAINQVPISLLKEGTTRLYTRA